MALLERLNATLSRRPALDPRPRSAAAQIVFRPIDVCPGIGFPCDCCLAEVLAASCGSGVKEGDTVQVWDVNRCYFNLPSEILFASQFTATLFKAHGGLVSPGDESPPGCIWRVNGSCCTETSELL